MTSTQFSTVIADAVNKFMITKIGDSSVTMHREVFNGASARMAAGDPLTGNPDSTEDIELSNVQATADGMNIVADAPPMWWFHPKVAISLHDAAPLYHAEVKIADAGPGDADTLYEISKADFDSVVAFAQAAGFPSL